MEIYSSSLGKLFSPTIGVKVLPEMALSHEYQFTAILLSSVDAIINIHSAPLLHGYYQACRLDVLQGQTLYSDAIPE